MAGNFTSSPWGFRDYSFQDYCRYLKKTGLPDICVFFSDPEKFPLAFRPDRDELEGKLETARREGVRFLEATVSGNYLQETMLANLLGVRYIRVCESWDDTARVFTEVVEKLTALGRLAAGLHLTVIVENHGGLMTTATGCRRLLEAVGQPNVRLNYDPANFLFFGEDPVAALDELLPFVGFTHCKNVRYDGGKPFYCRVTEGVIDYRRLFARLLPAYDGWIGLEYEEPADVEQGTADDLASLRMLLNHKPTEEAL